MGISLTDLIVRSDFSSETDFKNVLRKELFGKGSELFRFQQLDDRELDLVSAAGDADHLRKQEADRGRGQKM